MKAQNSKQPQKPAIVGNLLLAAVRFIQEISDRRVAKAMVAKLHSLPKEEWIAIDHEFNRWRFPMEFAEFIPKWWMKKGKWNSERAMRIISPLMQEVKNEFGDREQLRFHNVFKGKMTNEEFDYWFDNVSIQNPNRTDNAFNKYYERRAAMDRVRWWEDDVYEKLNLEAVS